MTGSALILALKSVVRHDELENVKRGILRDAIVEVSGTQILFHWIGLKKWTCELQPCLCIISWDYILRYQGGGGGRKSLPPQTYIRQK